MFQGKHIFWELSHFSSDWLILKGKSLRDTMGFYPPNDGMIWVGFWVVDVPFFLFNGHAAWLGFRKDTLVPIFPSGNGQEMAQAELGTQAFAIPCSVF